MLVQRREWDAGMDPETAARRGFNPRDFDLGHKLRLVDGAHDVFGDGSVVCLRLSVPSGDRLFEPDFGGEVSQSRPIVSTANLRPLRL